MKLIIHVPNFIDTDKEPASIEFSNLKELNNIDFIKGYIDSPGFHRLSIDKDSDGDYLMAEFASGYKWVVIGTIFPNADSLNLQEFKYGV